MRSSYSRRTVLGTVILLNLTISVCSGQNVTFATRSPFPLDTRLKFRQELNIYEWAYDLDFRKALTRKLSVDITEQFHSTLQRIQDQDLWKDNQSFYMGFRYDITSRLQLQPYMRSRILEDDLTNFDNDVKHHSANLRLGYQMTPNVRIAPEIASKWQTQLQQSDHGFGYAVDADVVGYNIAGYQNNLFFYGRQDAFPKRRNGDLNLEYTVQRRFYENTADTLTIFYDKLRRDSFDRDATSLFVRNLTQARHGIHNRLSYRIAANTTFFMRNVLASNSFRINNLREDEDAVDELKNDSGFESDNKLAVKFSAPTWNGSIGYLYRYHSRDDLREETTPDPFAPFATVGFDTKDVLVGLDAQGGHNFGKSDSLGFYTSVSKFEYTTTDSINRNDHDQLRWQATLAHGHRFGPDLHLIWRASAFFNHFVFIDSKFSGNNNWERVVQLVPELFYHPSRNFYSRQLFIVRAKYQTFDFDDPVTSTRNITNRYFILFNQTKVALWSGSWLDFNLHAEIAEQGRFFLDEWKQTLAMSWNIYEIQTFWRFRFRSSLTVSPGIRFFRQIRWQHQVNDERELSRDVESTHSNYGPVLEVSYQPSRSLQFLFYGNVQSVKSSNRASDRINIFDVNLNWYF